jgi:hypothetical protein
MVLAVRFQVFKSTDEDSAVEWDSEHPVMNYVCRYRNMIYIINSGSFVFRTVAFHV